MKKAVFLSLILFITLSTLSSNLYAQYISPVDLIQLYKYSQLDEPKFGQSAYKYLKTVDAKWTLMGNPTTDNDGVAVDYAYSKDGKSWYQPDSYHLIVSHEYGPPDQRAIIYLFKEIDTWELYNKQMVLMNAEKIGNGPNGGGQQTIYTVNDIAFILVEFPPGINGVDQTYKVTIMNNNK